jgi:hypothetical protein
MINRKCHVVLAGLEPVTWAPNEADRPVILSHEKRERRARFWPAEADCIANLCGRWTASSTSASVATSTLRDEAGRLGRRRGLPGADRELLARGWSGPDIAALTHRNMLGGAG